MHIQDIWQKLKQKTSREPLITVHISKSAILHNIETFKAYSGLPIIPVIKSNAYGHGLTLVGKILNDIEVPYIAIDSLFEAITLRKSGITAPLLLIGFVRPEEIASVKVKNITWSITSLDQAKEISKQLHRPAYFHIKVDTGMNRQGLRLEEIQDFKNLVQENKHLHITGAFTHLADADGETQADTEKQITVWEKVKKELESIPTITEFHLGGTGGSSFNPKKYANLLRVGLGIYGFHPKENSEIQRKLRPALSITTVITGIKKVYKNEKVGYNGTFIAEKDMLIATIPMGYNEGIHRALSNKGYVEVQNTLCPIIGRVSMNITTIDISAIPKTKIGDIVTVISTDRTKLNSIDQSFKLADSTPYQMGVYINPLLKRVLVD